MQKNRTLLYFKTVPEKSAYFPGDICWVPDSKAEEWIFDEHAIDASKTLDPKPYYAPDEVEKLSSAEEVQDFLNQKSADIQKYADKLKVTGKEIQRISAKITELRTKRDKKEVGTYQYVQVNTQIEELLKQLPELEETIKQCADKKKRAKILYCNAQIKYYGKIFKTLNESPEFKELDKQVKKVIEQNDKVKKLFKKATEGVHVGFTPRYPYLTGRPISLIENSLGKSDEILEEISEQIIKKFRSTLYEFYAKDFEGKLRDDE